jgi:hypothetical protein
VEPIVAVGPPGSEGFGSTEPPTLAIWEADDLRIEAPDRPALEEHDAAVSLPTGDVALRAGRQAIGSGDIDDAVILFSLVLRLAPPLAPAVLDAIDGRTERALALVRGDAYRLVGQEREARMAFADAARPDTVPPDAADQPDQADPPRAPDDLAAGGPPIAARPGASDDQPFEGDPP